MLEDPEISRRSNRMGDSQYNKTNLNEKDFRSLLGWLDPIVGRASYKYEEIRQRLIKLFLVRGCVDAEALADETINRVAYRIEDIRDSYQGDPTLYFYGVAKKLHREYLRQSQFHEAVSVPDTIDTSSEETEISYNCLERCLQSLSPDNRELILQYYQEKKGAKIDARKRLAEQRGMALNALRIRAYRIRSVLQQCIQECMEKQSSGMS